MLKRNMAAFRTNRTFDISFLLVMAILVWWAAANRVTIADRIFFLHYQPGPKTAEIAEAANLSSTGRTLLYRTNPTFANAATITAQCDIERLGCLSSSSQTFILDDPSKPNQTIVTAAHEMLHIAYRRLSKAKKAELAPLLDQAITQNGAAGIEAELHKETDPENRRDEAHSLLGTEYPNLSPKLEAYYTTYFTDRSVVLTAARSDH